MFVFQVKYVILSYYKTCCFGGSLINMFVIPDKWHPDPRYVNPWIIFKINELVG